MYFIKTIRGSNWDLVVVLRDEISDLDKGWTLITFDDNITSIGNVEVNYFKDPMEPTDEEWALFILEHGEGEPLQIY